MIYLKRDAPECESSISVSLYAHQKKSLLRMKEIESSTSITVDAKFRDFESIQNEVSSSIGILADKVGSGKTFTILALMAEKEHRIQKKSIPRLCSKLVSISDITIENDIVPSTTNLIIIPHSLAKQWKESTKKAFSDTNITYKFMTTKKECGEVSNIFDYDVVIVTVRQIDRLGIQTNHKFRRIVIDEPHDLNIPMKFIKNVRYDHLWFVCATPQTLLKNSRMWIRGFDLYNGICMMLKRSNAGGYQECYLTFSDFIVVQNRSNVIDASLNLPAYIETRIICSEPSWLRVLNGKIAYNALERLHAHDIRGALEVLQCKDCKDGDDILTIITREYTKNLEIAEIEVKKYTEMPSHLITAQTRKDKIEHYQKRAVEFREKIQHIKSRINEKSECPICLYDISSPRAITPCCQNSFCLECILESTKVSSRCPLCKKEIHIKDIVVEHENSTTAIDPEISQVQKRPKIDTLMDILKNRRPDQRYLVVSKFASVFDNITKKMESEESTRSASSTLSGTSSMINNVIDDFKKGNKPIILLNTQYFGSGLNLEMATDVIVFHRLSDADLKQAIGRAQRLGRTTPLRVTYLCHESEYH